MTTCTFTPAHLQRSCGPENKSAFPGELRELCKHLCPCRNPQEREHSFQAARVCLIRGLHSAGGTRVSTPAWRQGIAYHPQDTSPLLLFGMTLIGIRPCCLWHGCLRTSQVQRTLNLDFPLPSHNRPQAGRGAGAWKQRDH